MAKDDALSMLKRRIKNPKRFQQLLQEVAINAEIAQIIYDERTAKGLSQKELAKMIGTTQSVISRLEDADYDGHSLTMLQRIAMALDKELQICFKSPRKKSRT